jgi:cell division protein ZapD
VNLQGKVGQDLRDNEWLMSIKGRAAVPGGVCEFDLPSYHHWLHNPCNTRREDLYRWVQPFFCIRDCLHIVLRLLRTSGRMETYTAVSGVFQLMSGHRPAQMILLQLPCGQPSVPEISANKYALNIRFTYADGNVRPRTVESDVSFEMKFCTL